MDTVKSNQPMPDGKKCPQCGTPLPAGALAGLCPACLLKAGAAADTITDAKQPPFSPPHVAELAAKFPQLEILELIGQGGMGAVYKARQRQLDRIVALKILPPGIGDEPAFAERFAREAKALAKLNHPNIVTLYEFGDAGGQFYFLMEFVDGVNLRQLLHAGRISAREALAIVPQICDALQFAHDQGIVHRDIKPENILLDRRGRVKVADFGLAKIIEGRDGATNFSATEKISGNLTDAGKAMGTPNYMSPEQKEHPDTVDHRADIYALGVVFYQMLTGELPGKKIEPPSTKVQMDVRLDEIVLRALEKNPALRYQQVSEVKTGVETIVATPPRSSRREEAQTEKSEIGNRKSEIETRFSRTAIVGACLVCLTLVIGVSGPAIAGPVVNNDFRGIFGATLLPLLSLVFALGTTILGWVAVSQIRRSAGKLYGLWLAVFDGLFFPLFALDAGAFGFVVLMRMKVMLLGLPLMLVVDWLIIRRVWRAVNKSGAGVPPAEPQRKNSTGKLIAIGCGLLVLRAGIAVLSVHQATNDKLRAASLTSADFHYQVFEADAALVDRLIPATQRRSGVQPTATAYSRGGVAESTKTLISKTNSFSVKTQGAAKTVSSVAEISPDTLTELLDGIGNKPGILAGGTQTISGVWWPHGMPTIWSYSRQDDVFYWGGSGAINLAIRRLNGQNEIHIEGEVHNETDLNEIVGITSKFLYEGNAPQNGALAFLVPFFRKDNSAHYLVVVYDVGEATTAVTTNYPGDWIWEMNSSTLERVPPIFLLRPSTMPTNWVPGDMFGDDRFLARGKTAKELIATVWSQKNSALKIIFPAGLPEDRYDFIVAGDSHWWDTLQAELDRRFHLVEQIENRDGTDVVVVKNDDLAETAPAADSNLSFGPVIERVVTPVAPNPDGFVYVNLEKNELMTSPVTLNDERAGGDPVPHTGRFYQWITDSNANFAVYFRGTNVVLVPLGTRMFYRVHGRGNRDEFAQWTPLEVRSMVTDQEGPSGFGAMQKAPSDFGSMDGPFLAFPELPASFVIQTWQGALGILQIAGFTNNPPGVKIRYKLIKNETVAMTIEPADLREARSKLAELRVDYVEQNPTVQQQLARINELERLTREEPNDPPDLREAQAKLAELRENYSEQHPAIQKQLARIKELARLTIEEPTDLPDLREAKAHLAELRVDYGEQNPIVQDALARIKALEPK